MLANANISRSAAMVCLTVALGTTSLGMGFHPAMLILREQSAKPLLHLCLAMFLQDRQVLWQIWQT